MMILQHGLVQNLRTLRYLYSARINQGRADLSYFLGECYRNARLECVNASTFKHSELVAFS